MRALAVVCGFLAPVNGFDYPAQFGNFNPLSVELYFHLVVPALSILTFLFVDPCKRTRWGVNFLSVIPVALYGAFYVVNYFLHLVAAKVGDEITYDWYGFVKFAGVPVALAIFGGVVVVAFLLSLLLWAVNRGVHGKEEAKEEDDDVVEPVYVPAGRSDDVVKDEPKEEEVVAEPIVEDEPKEEVQPEPKPEKKEEVKKPAKKAATPKKEESKPVEEAPKAEEAPKSEEAKPAPKKVAAPKKEEAKKPTSKKSEAPKKEEAKPAPKKAAAPKKDDAKKPAVKKEEASKDGPTKVYHLTKRKEDNMWAITFVGGQKAVKLFKTKKEAEAALEVLTKNQGATALIRNSKGAKAGKFASSIKNKEE